jgi:hypothetical protein
VEYLCSALEYFIECTNNSKAHDIGALTVFKAP